MSTSAPSTIGPEQKPANAPSPGDGLLTSTCNVMPFGAHAGAAGGAMGATGWLRGETRRHPRAGCLKLSVGARRVSPQAIPFDRREGGALDLRRRFRCRFEYSPVRFSAQLRDITPRHAPTSCPHPQCRAGLETACRYAGRGAPSMQRAARAGIHFLHGQLSVQAIRWDAGVHNVPTVCGAVHQN